MEPKGPQDGNPTFALNAASRSRCDDVRLTQDGDPSMDAAMEEGEAGRELRMNQDPFAEVSSHVLHTCAGALASTMALVCDVQISRPQPLHFGDEGKIGILAYWTLDSEPLEVTQKSCRPSFPGLSRG